MLLLLVPLYLAVFSSDGSTVVGNQLDTVTHDFGFYENGNRLLQDTSCPDGSTLREIDFDTLPDGTNIQAGTFVTDQWSSLGIELISGTAVDEDDDSNNRARIFNSTYPTGNDYDIGSPNENCPGCEDDGAVCLGKAESSDEDEAQVTNCVAQNNILIIDENGAGSDPDDYAGGGCIVFTLDDSVVTVLSVGVMDIEGNSGGNQVQLKDSNEDVLVTETITGRGDNTWQEVELDQDFSGQASFLEVTLRTSGAVSSVRFCTGTSTAPELIGPLEGTLDADEANDEPTKEPTKAPTKTPTKTPTKAPTERPTKTPTKTPNEPPTKAPTEPPTKTPTEPPTTKTPTKAPNDNFGELGLVGGTLDVGINQESDEPNDNFGEAALVGGTLYVGTTGESGAPIGNLAPTLTPTLKPSNPVSSSSAPTSSSNTPVPTPLPSPVPTMLPPTTAPTSPPTWAPTPGPSVAPTTIPSATPTTVPSVTPSVEPSTEPTKIPTGELNDQPSTTQPVATDESPLRTASSSTTVAVQAHTSAWLISLVVIAILLAF